MLRPVIVDTEFAPRGGHYEVRCVSWHDMLSDQAGSTWIDGSEELPSIFNNPGLVLVVFSAHAELISFKSLGWPEPSHVIDLFLEIRALIHGNRTFLQDQDLTDNRSVKYSLLSAAGLFGIVHAYSDEEKARLQNLAAIPAALTHPIQRTKELN